MSLQADGARRRPLDSNVGWQQTQLGLLKHSKEGGMKLTVSPLTPDLWPALEDLFDTTGPCSRCWCMYWRIGDAYRLRPSEENRAALRDVVRRGPPPGLLAFDGDVAVGWCQLTPRDALPWLDRAWRLKRVDDVPVWAISCFYIRKGYRRRGITPVLISAAVDAARRSGAPALEAYPLDAHLTPSASSTGYVSTFERAGFKVVARHAPPRPIMRYDLDAITR
jgi:GNAT superfamily N-acetyltransferase